MCRYKSLLPQSCSWYSQIQRRTRQECATTSPYCLSPTVGTHRRRVELNRMCSYKTLLTQPYSRYSQMVSRTRQECATTSPYCLSPAVITQRQGEELDMNLQIQILIASVLHSVIKNREKNSIGMCSYKSLLPQSCSHGTHRQREELDRNVQIQVLIASVVQLVLTDREKNQIGMCSTSPYCLSPSVGTHRWREELDRNVQLQVLIDSDLQLLTDREKNKIGMCSYKFLLQSCSHSQTQRRTRQECAATSSYCLSPSVGTHRRREELDRNVQLQVLTSPSLTERRTR